MGAKSRSGDYIKFIAYLVVIVLINVAGVNLFYRIDLTADNIYSISEASKQVVSTLSEPLTIKVFFTRNLPAPYNNTERYLHDLLEEYAAYGNRYFSYRFYDVSAEEGDTRKETKENQKLAKGYGIYPLQIRIIKQDEAKFQKAYMGLVLIHGDIIEKIPTITSTDRLEYQLTTTIQKLNNKVSALLSLPEKIKIKLFFSSSLKIVAPLMRLATLPELPGKIEDIVEKLNDKLYGKLEFTHLDPTEDETLQAEVEKYKILNLKWPTLSDGKIPPGKGAVGLVMEYQEKAATIQLLRVTRIPFLGTHYELTDLGKMEETINTHLESLIDINETLGYLADHGTLRLSAGPQEDPTGRQRQETISTFRSLISRNYTLKGINLKEGAIPGGITCLVIARPTEPFTDYELFQIDQFLMQGKNLALFLDVFKEVMPPQRQGSPRMYNREPQFVPINSGLEKLLEHYGIRIKKSYALDEECYKQRMPAQFGGGERAVYYAPLIKNEFIDKELGFMKHIKGLVTLKASPLELNTDRLKENGLQAHRLFASSERSWEMSGRITLNPLALRPPKSRDEQKSLPLAYLIEGKFPSYFAGKPIPEKKASADEGEKKDQPEGTEEKADAELAKIEGEAPFRSKGAPGKIFLIGTAEMLKNNLLDERGETPNSMFIMNTLDYLNYREDIAEMRSKEQRFNPLRDTGQGIKTFVKSFNVAGLPVLVVLFGLLVWFNRHSRKKHIQMMFKK